MTDIIPEMAGPFAVYLLAFAAGGILPDWNRHAGSPGVRAFSGFALLVVVIFVCQTLFRLSAPQSLVAATIVAGCGLLRFSRRPRLNPEILTHPAVVFPAAFALFLIARGGNIDYLPLAWDEYSNWMSWARQFLEYGNVLDPRIQTGVPGYSPGWPIILALPSILYGDFHAGRAVAMFALFHMLFLSLAYDVVVALCRRSYSPRTAAIIGWATILGLATVEASWKLVPTNLLIEEPQTYTIAAVVLLAWAAHRSGETRVAVPMGLAFALSYVIKGAALAFAPSVILMFAGILLCRSDRSIGRNDLSAALILAALILGPAAIWSSAGMSADFCLSNSALAFKGAWSRIDDTARVLDLLERLSLEIWAYLASYKVALTLSALLGLAVSAYLQPRILWIWIPFFIYFFIYEFSIFVYHLDCLGDFYFKNLNSIPRFTRVPLRTLHVIGLSAAAVSVLTIAPRLMDSRPKKILAALAAVALFVVQMQRMTLSVQAVETRSAESPQLVRMVKTVKSRMEDAVATVVGRNLDPGPVIVIDQGNHSFASVLANFYGNGRLKAPEDSSWGEVRANPWMKQTDPATMRAELLGSRMIMPLQLDAWMIHVLEPLTADPTCLSGPLPAWLLRGPEEALFRCAGDLKDFH